MKTALIRSLTLNRRECGGQHQRHQHELERIHHRAVASLTRVSRPIEGRRGATAWVMTGLRT